MQKQENLKIAAIKFLFKVSQFNLENVTIFNKDPTNSTLKLSDENGEKMDVDADADQANESVSEQR